MVKNNGQMVEWSTPGTLPRDFRIPRGDEVAEKTMDFCQDQELTAAQGFLSGFAGALDSEIQSQHPWVKTQHAETVTIWPCVSDHAFR